MAIALRGIRVGPSPAWLTRRLEAAGVRSINNVVDITNYMVHGYGQPMHAFDLDKMVGDVTVRRARQGERLVTLDGVERPLDASMVVIADSARALGLAGVIGGRDSEVTDTTTRIMLEVASFPGQRVRKTARALGVSTDASYRYERGVPVELPRDVAAIAVGLLETLAGASLEGQPTVVAQAPAVRVVIPLRLARVGAFLGVPVPGEEVARLLSSIGFSGRIAPRRRPTRRSSELPTACGRRWWAWGCWRRGRFRSWPMPGPTACAFAIRSPRTKRSCARICSDR